MGINMFVVEAYGSQLERHGKWSNELDPSPYLTPQEYRRIYGSYIEEHRLRTTVSMLKDYSRRVRQRAQKRLARSKRRSLEARLH